MRLHGVRQTWVIGTFIRSTALLLVTIDTIIIITLFTALDTLLIFLVIWTRGASNSSDLHSNHARHNGTYATQSTTPAMTTSTHVVLPARASFLDCLIHYCLVITVVNNRRWRKTYGFENSAQISFLSNELVIVCWQQNEKQYMNGCFRRVTMSESNEWKLSFT